MTVMDKIYIATRIAADGHLPPDKWDEAFGSDIAEIVRLALKEAEKDG
jgi:hypothetical protein